MVPAAMEGFFCDESTSFCGAPLTAFLLPGVRLQQEMPPLHIAPPQSASVLQGCPQLQRQVLKTATVSDGPLAVWLSSGTITTCFSVRSARSDVWIWAGDACVPSLEAGAAKAATVIRSNITNSDFDLSIAVSLQIF